MLEVKAPPAVKVFHPVMERSLRGRQMIFFSAIIASVATVKPNAEYVEIRV